MRKKIILIGFFKQKKAVNTMNKHGKEAINAFADGDEQRMMLLGLKRFTKYGPFNSKDARRRIADKLISEGRYCF